MFKKILVANRGEIACRVIATCKRMGIETVAVYSDADQGSRHSKMADYAVAIDTAEVKNSYSSIDAILNAAIEHGVEAIHPGYGFLSENPEFASKVLEKGFKFIGPSPDAIRLMGMKDQAKDIALAAEVPIIPGYQGNIQSDDFLYTKAQEVGFPILIKPRAGGGGKGMRLVKESEYFLSELKAAKSESLGVFGDSNIILEKFFPDARHIEVQIFADKFGNIIHTFDRECSIQRRYQKLIEEAPAPFISDEIKHDMFGASIRLAKEITYSGAGTVEFLLVEDERSQKKQFFFMEMNTRLQVEHPVSEAITGLDFVQIQLNIAFGNQLNIRQEEVLCDGHSIESRICAEDPQNKFMPSLGKIYDLILPFGSTNFDKGNVRVDHALDKGTVITPFYDPMIAKLIVHGSNRNDTIRKSIDAINEIRVKGIASNSIFLSKILSSEAFSLGKINTNFLSKNIGPLTHNSTITYSVLGAIAVKFFEIQELMGDDPWLTLKGWTNFNSLRRIIEAKINDKDVSFFFSFEGLNKLKLEVDDRELLISFDREEDSAVIRMNAFDDKFFYNDITDSNFQILNQTDVFRVVIKNSKNFDDDANVENGLCAKLPGIVKKLFVSEGDSVSKGDLLLILEAMKMEQRILAPRDGYIKRIDAEEGSQISVDHKLIELE